MPNARRWPLWLAVLLLAVTAGPVGAVSLGPVARAPSAGFAVGATLGPLRVPVRISWPAAAADGAALKRYYRQRRADGGSWSDVALPSALARSVTVKLRPGNGNSSPPKDDMFTDQGSAACH